MKKETVGIVTEYIAMDKLLKFSGVADTGGQASWLIEEGHICLNGQPVSEKRKKVYSGDVVTVGKDIELTVVRE